MNDNPTKKLDRNKVNAVNDGATKPIGNIRPTVVPQAKAATPATVIAASAREKTQVVRSQLGQRPVTGWLAIIDGPGKGASLSIYHGMNSVGRGRTVGEGGLQREQEICLDFGRASDQEIAREVQAKLTYDPKSNMFYLQHGGASNLTYLNDQPALELKTLNSHDKIVMGKTTLLFIPLCNDKFQWPDE